MDLKDKVVVLTGASAGIGRATAVSLAQSGANLVVTARRKELLNTLVNELSPYPGQRIAVAGDIQEEGFCQLLIDTTLKIFGHVNVLINNAGLGHRSNLADMATVDIETIIKTNIFGLLYLTRAVIPQMKQQRFGQIINVSSIVGVRPLPNSSIYCASKTAVNFISRSLRIELRPYNIKVTLVYPGLTATEFAVARLGEKGTNRFGLKGISADRVGKVIARAIKNGRQEVYITWYDWLFTHFNRIFPRTGDWVLALGRKYA